MKHYLLIGLGITIVTLGFTTNTLASGTYAPSRGGGDNYHMAKLIFYKKIVCDSCPFPNRGKSAEDARMLLNELDTDSGTSNLSSKEQRAANIYLQRRFKLN